MAIDLNQIDSDLSLISYCDRCLSRMTLVSSSTVVFAEPLFWNVQLIRVTVERNEQRQGRRNRKTWYF